MRTTIVLALLASGCSFAAPTPTGPSPAPPSASEPASLTIGVSATAAGGSTISAHVLNSRGAPIAGATVGFFTDSGRLSDTLADTNLAGTAAVTWTGVGSANISVSAGTLSAHWVVSSVPPTPPSSPALQFAVLNPPRESVSTINTPLIFSVSSAVTGVTWYWTFGDGETMDSPAFTITHSYVHAGTYTATVSSPLTITATGTTVVIDPIVKP